MTFLCFLVDQISKQLIVNNISTIFPEINLFKGFSLVYVENKGVSFGFLSQYDISFYLGILSVIISFYIIFLIYKSPQKIEAFGLSLILGGALGNGLDRLKNGYVVDFIDVSYNNLHWPAFNFADSFITIGAIIFFINIFKNK